MYDDDKLRLIYLTREAEDFDLIKPKTGSFSFLVEDKPHVLITPASLDFFTLRPDDVIVVDRSGSQIENLNNNRVPDDLNLHLICYEQRSNDIDVVAHIYPENASKRANEGKRVVFLSDIIDPSDDKDNDISNLIRDSITHRDYMLIKNDGVITVGRGIYETLDKSKYIEEISKINMNNNESFNFEKLNEKYEEPSG